MTETMVAAIIGAAISLITTMLTLSVTASIEKSKVQAERQQRKEEAKREKLTDIYTELVSIINSYPKESPNNVENIEYPLHYSMESFDSIIDTLNYQIDDYKRLLENKSIGIEAKNHNKTQIRKREYAIEQGYISFQDDGKMIISECAKKDTVLFEYLKMPVPLGFCTFLTAAFVLQS